MADDKTSPRSSLEKANTNSANVSMVKQIKEIIRNSKTAEEMWAAIRPLDCPKWIQTHKPPMFVTPLSRDPPEVRAAAMEAALKEPGADLNEFDHDLRDNMRHAGRVLHCCVFDDIYEDHNMGHEDDPYYGNWYNLPVIKILLRHGADPRLYGFRMLYPPGSPLDIARYHRGHPAPPSPPPFQKRRTLR
jgi:hypothetical protein